MQSVAIRICAEFERIKERCLKVPETSEELMEMIDFAADASISQVNKLFNSMSVGDILVLRLTCLF